MRIVSFLSDGIRRLGVVVGDQVISLADVDASLPNELNELLETEGLFSRIQFAIDAGSGLRGFPLAEATLAMPIAPTSKIICVGLNYIDHAHESPYKDLPAHPVLFTRYASSFVAAEENLMRPSNSEQFDWEGEMVAIIGRKGRHISKDEALDYVAAYSIANEASVRDWQLKTTQWTLGKNFDASGSIGPEIVTADELPRGGAGLKITTRINGIAVQNGNTADMIFDLATVISFISEAMTLMPGDAILTGTPAGVGFARKPQQFLKDGDVCEVEVERLGMLRNSVRDEKVAL